MALVGFQINHSDGLWKAHHIITTFSMSTSTETVLISLLSAPSFTTYCDTGAVSRRTLSDRPFWRDFWGPEMLKNSNFPGLSRGPDPIGHRCKNVFFCFLLKFKKTCFYVFFLFFMFFCVFKCRVFVVVKTKTYKITNMMHFLWSKSAKDSISWSERVFCSGIIDFIWFALTVILTWMDTVMGCSEKEHVFYVFLFANQCF